MNERQKITKQTLCISSLDYRFYTLSFGLKLGLQTEFSLEDVNKASVIKTKAKAKAKTKRIKLITQT